MRPKWFLPPIIAVFFFCGVLASASERSLNAAYSQWRNFSRPHKEWNTQKPTPEELSAFAQQIRDKGGKFAEQALSFAERNPDNRVGQFAYVQAIYALNRVLAAGDLNAEAKIRDIVQSVLQNPKVPENTKVEVLLESGDTAFMKKAGMSAYTEVWGGEHLESMAATYDEALKMFPGHPAIYAEMLNDARHYARGNRQRALAQRILDSPEALPGAKAAALDLIRGAKPYAIGKPIDLRFTSMDGEAVDVARFKGRVVAVHFWATYNLQTCSEALKLKALQDKFKNKGFEVIGICLDEKKNDLRQFLLSRKISWPQHWDGLGWKSEIATRFEVDVIPQLWLLDKQGVLREINPGSQLQKAVESLVQQS